MDVQALFFPLNNDIQVTAQFPEITSGAGITSEFWYKQSKYTADTDPTSLSFSAALEQDTTGMWYAQFEIPATDNATPGAYWWRVDTIDAANHRQTANAGPVIVESV